MEGIAQAHCRMHWVPYYTLAHCISDDGRTLSQPYRPASLDPDWKHAWACGPVLPLTGTSTWEVVLQYSIVLPSRACDETEEEGYEREEREN